MKKFDVICAFIPLLPGFFTFGIQIVAWLQCSEVYFEVRRDNFQALLFCIWLLYFAKIAHF